MVWIIFVYDIIGVESVENVILYYCDTKKGVNNTKVNIYRISEKCNKNFHSQADARGKTICGIENISIFSHYIMRFILRWRKFLI